MISAISLASCDILDKDETVPGFVRITNADLTTILNSEGAATHNIVDVHVFANEKFVGTFELPATVPILENGITRLNINAGIKSDGLTSNRQIYPFYAPLLAELNLEPGIVTPLNTAELAVFEYFPSGLNFFIEDFESIGNALQQSPNSTAIFTLTNEPNEVRSGSGSLRVELTPENDYFLATTTWDLPVLPRGRDMYMEIDFRGTNALEIGVITETPEFTKTFAIGLLPQDEYTKVYIDMTSEISSQFQTSAVKFYFESKLQPGQSESTILIDNLKFVFPEI